MCLAVPGKILKVKEINDGQAERLGVVDFHGSEIEVSLSMVPESKAGDFVLVHAGYAIEILDEQQAKETWDYLKQSGVEIDGLGL